MEDLKTLGKFISLRESEKRLKKLYTSHPEFSTGGPLSFEDFMSQYQAYAPKESALLSKSLPEESYFQHMIDVSALMHLRYLPPIFHTSEFFEIDCVLSGTITYYMGEQRFDLTPGDVCILAPDTSHAACTFTDDGIMINLLVRRSTFEEHFLGILPEHDLFQRFFEKSLYGKSETPYLLFRTGRPDFLGASILPIYEEYESKNRYKSTMLSSLLSVFFVELLRHHEKDLEISSHAKGTYSENIIFILEYLQKNYTTISLSHLSAFFNYSERQMQRIIVSATGMSFGDNIKKLRMTKAAELLENSTMTIAQIAEYLGYYDASSFRQAFKKYYGRTPRAL